jgi:hypothetical protein
MANPSPTRGTSSTYASSTHDRPRRATFCLKRKAHRQHILGSTKPPSTRDTPLSSPLYHTLPRAVEKPLSHHAQTWWIPMPRHGGPQALRSHPRRGTPLSSPCNASPGAARDSATQCGTPCPDMADLYFWLRQCNELISGQHEPLRFAPA